MSRSRDVANARAPVDGAGREQVAERNQEDEQEHARDDHEPVGREAASRRIVVNGYKKMISTSRTMNAIATG